MKHTK